MKKGITIVLVVLIIIAAAGIVLYMVLGNSDNLPASTNQTNSAAYTNPSVNQASSTNSNIESSDVTWSFNGTSWQSSVTPPACPEPLELQRPVDVSKATAILYPGQSRGGDYKPHGGLRFDGVENNAVTVRAPLDGSVVQGARYIEQGEVQYMFDVQNPCGIRYRFDHLLTLSPVFAELADQLPDAQEDDSRTTPFNEPYDVRTGDVIAIAVGFRSTSNVGVDFGVYDLREKNIASEDPAWASSHGPEMAQYAVCWLSWLGAADSATVQALPAGDQTSGTLSDYCE